MTDMLLPAMLHRPLSLDEQHWRAGFLDVMAEKDPAFTLPVDQAAFVVRITTEAEAKSLAEEMKAQTITEKEVLDAIAARVPGSTESMPVGVGRMREQGRGTQARLQVNTDPDPVFEEEWRQIGLVLDDLIPGRKIMEDDTALVPRMQLWQSADRPMIRSIKKALDNNSRLTREPTIELAGVRMGDSEEVVASYYAGIERRIRRATLTQRPFARAALLAWVEDSPYSMDEVSTVLLAAQEAGRLVVESASEAGLVCVFES